MTQKGCRKANVHVPATNTVSNDHRSRIGDTPVLEAELDGEACADEEVEENGGESPALWEGESVGEEEEAVVTLVVVVVDDAPPPPFGGEEKGELWDMLTITLLGLFISEPPPPPLPLPPSVL
jgi:hypothetical protein